MTQQISRPPKKAEESNDSTMLSSQSPIARKSMIALLVVVGLVLVSFTGLFIRKSPDLIHPPADPVALTATVIQQNALPVQLPGGADPAQLQLAGSHTIIYSQQNALYSVKIPAGTAQAIQAPGYHYNRAVPPILLANGHLLYSGNGLWMTSISGDGSSRQLASIADDEVITSLVLAPNGRDIAWSVAPANGKGTIRIYAGLPDSPSLVYQGDATQCPCFRVFSVVTGSSGQMTLLLSNDYGDHQLVMYNLWSLAVVAGKGSEPKPLLASNPPQMPLAEAGNTLLYSTANGNVPFPTDNSAPDDVAALNYANGLALSVLSPSSSSLASTQVVLPSQRVTAGFSSYHWIMSPRFSPDGRTLTYVQFSSDDQVPFARHSSLYTVHVSDTGVATQTALPEVLATSSARFVESGPWLDNSILTFYADNAFYAIDTRTGATTLLTRLKEYGQILLITGS